MKECSVPSCVGPSKSKGFCQAHYMRLWMLGDVHADKPVKRRIMGDDNRRFWSKVVKGTGCWEWQAGKLQGYGLFNAKGHNVLAHRYAYELTGRLIPSGLQIDHLCRNRSCVRASHLEVVTNKINTLRGISPNAQNARKTACLQGHPFSRANTYIRPDTHHRQCRECKRDTKRRYEQRHRARSDSHDEARLQVSGDPSLSTP